MSEDAFIYEAIRTPRGKQRGGALNEIKPVRLVVGLIDELRSRFPDLDENLISDLILGVVSPVGDQGGYTRKRLSRELDEGSCEQARLTHHDGP